MESTSVESRSTEKMELNSDMNSTEPEQDGFQLKLSCDYCCNHFPVASLSKCSRCKRVFYCDRECQKKDWKEHKSHCEWYVNLMKEHHDCDESQRQIYDLARESPETCQICCEVIYGRNYLCSFPDCFHGFCVSCLKSHQPLFKDDVRSDEGSKHQECPLCCKTNEKNLYSCYFHIIDFTHHAESLFPKGSLPSQHYSSVAQREYNRLLTLIPLFPNELTPFQNVMLEVKTYDLLHLDEDNEQRLRNKKKLAKQLLKEGRVIKDAALRLEIHSYYIKILIELKELKEAKKVCSAILREIRDVHEPGFAVLKFKYYQPFYSQIKRQWIDIKYQQALSEEDHAAKEIGFEEVIRLSRTALGYNRVQTDYYILLADVYERLLNFKEAILALEIGLQYDLRSNQEETEKMRSKLKFLKEVAQIKKIPSV